MQGSTFSYGCWIILCRITLIISLITLVDCHPKPSVLSYGSANKSDRPTQQNIQDNSFNTANESLREINNSRLDTDGKSKFKNYDNEPRKLERDDKVTDNKLPEPFSLSIEPNPSIQRCIKYYVNKYPRDLKEGMERGSAYFSMINRKLVKRGLPQEILWIPFVESGYRPRAVSSSYAKGMWQLMPILAKQFGLRIDDWIDERVDPETSTDVALDALEYFYDRTGNWLLAFAAYNSGEGQVNKAIRAVGSRNYWELAESKSLPSQTRFYVSAILAIQHITQNAQAYGLSFEMDKSTAWETVFLDHQIDLSVAAKCAGATLETIMQLNPALKRQWTPPGYPKFPLRLKREEEKGFLHNYAQITPANYLKWATYEVERGDTLGHIASLYRSSVSEIMKVNGLTKTLIITGWTLVIPVGIISP